MKTEQGNISYFPTFNIRVIRGFKQAKNGVLLETFGAFLAHFGVVWAHFGTCFGLRLHQKTAFKATKSTF